MRIAKARAATDQISETAAITALRREKAEKLDAGILDKAGKRIRFMSRRQLAVAYAVERVERTRKDKGDALPTAVAYCLLQKFSEATQLYIRGKRKGPRFKKQQDSVSLQAQIYGDHCRFDPGCRE